MSDMLQAQMVKLKADLHKLIHSTIVSPPMERCGEDNGRQMHISQRRRSFSP